MEKTEITLEYLPEDTAFEPEGRAPLPFGKAILPKKAAVERPPRILRKLAAYGAFCLMGVLWGRLEVLQILHPMGMAYLSAFFGEGLLFWCVLPAVGIGGMFHAPLKTGAFLAAAAATQLTLGRFVRREEGGKKALLGAFSMGLAGIFFAISRSGLGFYFAVALVESALTLTVGFLAEKGVTLLLQRTACPVYTREETLSLLLLAGGALAGLASVEEPFLRDALLPCLSVFFLLLAARREGIGGGAAAGVFLGFLLFLCGAAGMSLFIALSLGGMLAGCFRELGRLASATAMIFAPVIFLFYIEPEQLQPIWMGGLIAGAAMFSLFPTVLLEKLAGGLWETESPADRYTKMKELAEEKLLGFSRAFETLSKTFVLEGERKDKGEISKLVDTIAGRVCQDCGMAHYCWEEELYRTYGMTFSALSYCDGRGQVGMEQMPEHFKKDCTRPAAFLKAVNEVYTGYRRDCLWTSRLTECRELVSEQLLAVGGILKDLSGEMEPDCIFLENMAETLTAVLRKNGFRPKKVLVTEEQNGKGRRVRLTLGTCGGKGLCRSQVLPLIRKTMGCPMTLREDSPGVCRCDAEEKNCILQFWEEPPFCLTMAAAISPAEEGMPVGDAAAFFDTEYGTALMALSDGMGTGEKAAKESQTAIELLEQFTQAGFGRELAVKMINSALLLRRGEESYATLDICGVDLYNGKAEFIKLGASASYISRGGRVISLRSASLPAGILKQVTLEKNEMQLKDGDMVFLVTDGVTDALDGEERTSAWLREKLAERPMANPQEAAEYILHAAKKERRDGRTDDMTVVAGRFWKKRIP